MPNHAYHGGLFMKRALLFIAFGIFSATPVVAQQEESYDYWRFNRDMIQHGVQAVLMCNGLFTSNRTIEQVFEQELAYVRQPVGTARGGDYKVDWERKAVAIGAAGGTPTMRAAYRNGLGCVIMAPDQTFEDIPSCRRWICRHHQVTPLPLRGPTAT